MRVCKGCIHLKVDQVREMERIYDFLFEGMGNRLYDGCNNNAYKGV